MRDKLWLLLLAGVMLLQFCAPGRQDFQTFEPESKVKLTELFNQTPAIRSAFNSLNPNEFNRRMTALMHRDPVSSLRFLLALADLADSGNPANPAPLPRIFDSLSYDIAQLAAYYQQHQEEFNTAVDVGTRVLDVNPEAITGLTGAFAKVIRYVGDTKELFPDDDIDTPPGHNVFPSHTLWKRCKDPNGDFAAAMPVSDYEGRNTLGSLYDVLRIAYCIYDGREPASEEPGAFMRKTFETIRDAGDVENRMANMAFDLIDKRDDLRSMEASLADWLVRDPLKVEITDFLTTHGYTVIRKNFIFTDGKPILDLQAAHLAVKNPGYSDPSDTQDHNQIHREYLLEWLLESLYQDSPLLDKLDDDAITDLSVVYGHPLYDFGKQLVHNSTYGYKNALMSEYMNSRLSNILWHGFNYNSTSGPIAFKGLLYNDGLPVVDTDGPVAQMAQRTSTQTFRNHFRQKLATDLSGVLNVPTTYNGESMLAAILKNMYLYLKSNYYSKTHNRWALDANDAQTYFNDPERSLLKYLGSLQYSLRNSVVLNPYGETPGNHPTWAQAPGNANAAYKNLPYLSALLYTISASNGLVDPVNAPAELTLGKSLASMGANINPTTGIRTIDLPSPIPDMDVRVACPGAPPCETRVWRNNEDYTTALNMFDFELLSPGRFISRTGHSGPGGFTNNGWRGSFSPQQGDVETTKLKTSNWVMAEMALNTWQGYGPYTYKGRAPNGSAHKYQNDYVTDNYRIVLKYRTAWNGSYTQKFVAMGSNSGFEDDNDPQIHNGSIIGNTGNYHVYERIYIPKNPGDPCYSDSRTDGVNTYPHARFGYIRPTNNQNYHNNSNCTSWPKHQIDYDTMEEAVAANLEWLLKYKKYTFVIPLSGDTDMCVLGVCNGAAFVVVSTINANGVYGVTNAKRACGTSNCNGRWNSNMANMSANSKGLIPNLGNGFIGETPQNGADRTVRFGVTSFEAADSNVVLDISARYWGLTFLLVDVMQEIWDTLGDGPVTPAIIAQNFAPILAMSDARYLPTDLMATPANGPLTDLNKFKKFYDTYFPTDETSCVAGVIVAGSNGTPDLFENYQNNCIKAIDLPPVPRVNPDPAVCRPGNTATCIQYPRTYASNGSVATWYPYTGASESRFGGILLPFAMIVGTMHEDGNIRKPDGNLLGAGENRDVTGIRNFESNGFREHIDTLLTVFTTLNDAEKQTGNNLPQYNSAGIINRLTETTQGARNGFLPKMVTNKYANVAYLDPLVNDIESLIKTLVQHTMNQFELTRGNSPGTVKNIDKLRFFMTMAPITEGKFTTNNLGKDSQGRPNGTSDEPINQLKSFLAYIRTLTSDEDIKAAIKAAIPTLNNYFTVTNSNITINLSDSDIDKIIGFLNAKSSNDEYILDGMLDLIVALKINDLRQLYDFDFDNFKNLDTGNFAEQLDEINRTIDEYFGENYKKKLLYSWAMLGEPTCPGGHTTGYLDYNGNGQYDRGLLLFVNAAYSSGLNYNETTNVGATCNVTVPEPNIYEPHYYVLNLDNAVWYLNDKIMGLTATDVSDALDWAFGLNYDVKINEVKNTILGDVYDTKLAEPSVDRNNNGVIEADEYTDINYNGQYDHENSTYAPTLREFIGYYVSNNSGNLNRKRNRTTWLLESYSVSDNQSKFRNLYADLRGNILTNEPAYIKAGLILSDELLNPINPINTTCTDDDPNNDSANCLYITSQLLQGQQKFFEATNFTPAELKAVKNVVGRFFYDESLGEYTYPISNIAPELSQFIRGFSGQYVAMLDMGVAGFQPDGFLTYLAQMKTDPQYSGLDVLLDLRTLANSEVMRCYTGKNTDYCLSKTRKEMFWPQLSDLLRGVAEMAYVQHGFTFSHELNNKYHQRIVAQFQ